MITLDQIAELRTLPTDWREHEKWLNKLLQAREDLLTLAERQLRQEQCPKCHGAGWLYPHEVDDHRTDNRYLCECQRKANTEQDVDPFLLPEEYRRVIDEVSAYIIARHAKGVTR